MRLLDRRLVRLAGRIRWAWMVVVAVGAGAGVATVIQATLLAQLIDLVFLHGADRFSIRSLAWVLVGVILIRALLVAGERMAAVRLADVVVENLRSEVTEHLCRLGPVGLGRYRAGELRTTLSEGLDDIHAWFRDYLPQVALSAVVPVIVLFAVVPLDLISTLVLLLTAPLIPLFMVLIGRLAEARSRRQFQALGRLGAAFLELIQGLSTLAAMGRAETQTRRAVEVTHDLRRTTMATLRLAFLSAFALELLATLSTAVVAVEVGLRLMYGRMEFVDAFAVLLLAPEFYLPLRMLGQRFHSGMAGVAAADRVASILEREPPVSFPASDRSEAAMPHHPVIVLHAVTARYPADGDALRPAALLDVDLELGRGEVVAVVGPSGAGKSTLLHLLLRFLAPVSGWLSADGMDAAAVPLEAWRRRFSWVPQRPWLVTGTVAENLRLGRPDADDEVMREALVSARAEEFVAGLPLGVDTPLGEGGARLSGGQAQRLALARAFVREAPIVLLDEPGAGLDARLLGELDETVSRLVAGRSAVIVAHRPAWAERADRVLVMDAGRIVDSGPPGEIFRRRPDLWAGVRGRSTL